MRLPCLIGLLFLGIFSCGKTRRPVDDASTTAPQLALPVVAVASTAAPLTMLPGSWEPGDRTQPRTWTLRGKDAPPLVVRGVVQPVNADSNMASCPELLGARHGEAPLTLHIADGPRTLFVFAKARGPIGIAGDVSWSDRCATAGANKWARLVIPEAKDDVTIPIMDVDVAGERSGQTSPYVVVVSEVDEVPKLEPEPRAPVDASDLVVRWAVSPRACPPEIEHFHCWTATIDILDPKGNSVKKVTLKDGLVGQSGCWPDGTGVHCGGPSGMTVYSLERGKMPSDTVTVLATGESDGYCPPPEDCTSRQIVTKFTIPRGKTLVADPGGTWPAIMRP